jgi:hypothetical protein
VSHTSRSDLAPVQILQGWVLGRLCWPGLQNASVMERRGLCGAAMSKLAGLYSGGDRFGPRPSLIQNFRAIPQFLQAYARIIPRIRPRPLPFTSSPVYFSMIIYHSTVCTLRVGK